VNALLQDIYAQPSELRKVLDDLSEPKLKEVIRIAQMLSVADEIVLTSMGSAFYSLMPMYDALKSKGKRVELVETAELLHYPERINKNALFLMMSRSGESREVADFSKYLKKNHCVSVTVTMTPTSTMAKNAEIVLHDIASYDSIVCIKAYSSMALCGMLCVSMMERGTVNQELSDELYKMFDWMDQNKENILAQIEAIPFIGKANNFYMLSRGYGINMMRSGSLWMEETAKICANVMSIDNFYHGPMEIIRSAKIVKSVTTPVFLDTCPDKRSSMIWEKIKDCVPESIYIGQESDCEECGEGLYYPHFNLENGYRMIIQALFLQLLSYRTAIAYGIEPGMFFDEGWVVT
jgi:glucosamine 6-phosphate synthetase-like amidotransferase/phosphosugar isomerase protein